ncbi:FG-GAP-like repeat-containing protein [Flagellimonas onchidii]|uniref:FG-GAP-like repeat-containing protein n=1 Tax=Flagellimonas onchidii TaxID=2562684 RepID=UPI00145624A9|nr:FG-GAP-like repeat-containing protein [Allomuricauda onchidii]
MKLFSTVIGLFCATAVLAQNPQEDKIKTTNFPKLKELVSTEIPGAITFSQPQLITGTKQEIRTEKHGLIYPAFYDWNKDGKKDLLLGEFETGQTGSNIKVYINKGSKKNPKFSGEYFYATDVKGDTITNYQWCCIGIHPRLVDLDQDGYDDILSGQYNPGAISWWRGSKEGFLPRVFIEQEGYRDTRALSQEAAPWKTDSNSYWNYTTADFADFNGDGLLDLFVGGSGDMRVALNEGTKEQPKFGHRNYLHHVDGRLLEVKRPSQEKIDEAAKRGRYVGMAGVWKTYMKPVDWDKDGVLDLLVTYEYKKKYHNAIDFYRGVNTDKGIRFEKRVPLVTAKDGTKALPGVQPMMTLTDYNNDGVQDIVFGLSIPTINGFEAANEIAWAWAGDLKIEMPGKDAGRQIAYYKGGLKEIKERFLDPQQGKFFKQMMLGNLDDEKYLTMRHRGYVFVMYGKKAISKATAKTVTAAPAEVLEEIKNEVVVGSNGTGPVQYQIKVPQRIDPRKGSFFAEVTITFDDKWHGYVDNKANKKDGFIPTTVTFQPSEWIEPVGNLVVPKESYKGLAKVYKGAVVFKQEFKLKRSANREEMERAYQAKHTINTKVTYQTCDDNICLPPKTIEQDIEMMIQ